jgi:hypothetical protein
MINKKKNNKDCEFAVCVGKRDRQALVVGDAGSRIETKHGVVFYRKLCFAGI